MRLVFAGTPQTAVPALDALLASRHEVVAVRLVDPREYELPDAGMLFVEDAETGEQMRGGGPDQDDRSVIFRRPGARELGMKPEMKGSAAFLGVKNLSPQLLAALRRAYSERLQPGAETAADEDVDS